MSRARVGQQQLDGGDEGRRLVTKVGSAPSKGLAGASPLVPDGGAGRPIVPWAHFGVPAVWAAAAALGGGHPSNPGRRGGPALRVQH